MDEQDKSEEVTTTEHETDTDTEGEGEAADEGESSTEGDSITLTRAELDERIKAAKKEQDKRWKERIKGTEKGTETKEVGDERYNRLELKTEGITNKKEQDVVLEYAAFKKIEVTEALKSPAVKAELAELRAKASVPAPSTRTNGGASNSLEYWAAQAKKGNFPTDPEIRRQLRKMRIFTT